MLRKELSLVVVKNEPDIVKNEPDIDYIAYSGDHNSKITDDLKYNESEIKLENDNEILHIKQEDLNIKDEIQMADDNQNTKKKLFACSTLQYTIFNCNLCEYQTTYKHVLARHIRTHTGGKPHACSVCEFKASQECNLNIHEKAHTEEKLLCPCVCSIRELKYSCKSHLKNHTLNIEITREKLLFICSMCEFTDSQKWSWIKHQRMHREKLLKCSMCEFTSYQKRSLINHQRIHRVKKPLACIMPRMSV